MSLEKLSEFGVKLLARLRQYSVKDVQNGFELFKSVDVFVSEREEDDSDICTVDIVNTRTDNLMFTVDVGTSEEAMMDWCECQSFNKTDSCKHIAAAIIQIIHEETELDLEDIKQQLFAKTSTGDAGIESKTSGMVVPLFKDKVEAVPWKTFKSNSHNAFQYVNVLSQYFRADSQMLSNIKLLDENKDKASWAFEFKSKKTTQYFPEINYDKNQTFQYKCTCQDKVSMCIHVKTAFDWLQHAYSINYFDGFKNWDKEKAMLLREYGLQPGDEEAKQIQFDTDYYGNLKMKVPSWLWAKDSENRISIFKKLLTPQNDYQFNERPKLTKDAIIDFQIGFLFNFTSMHFKTGFELEILKVFEKNTAKSFKKLSIHNAVNLPLLKELDDEVYDWILNLSDEGVKKHLEKNSNGYFENFSNPWYSLNDVTIQLLYKYYFLQLQKPWAYLSQQSNVYKLIEGNFSNKNIQPAKLSADFLTLSFLVQEDDRFVTITIQFIKNEKIIDSGNILLCSMGITIIDEVLHILANIEDLDLLHQFKAGYIKIPLANRLSVITNIIPTLQKKYNVQVTSSLQLITIKVTPKQQVLLQEFNTQYLMLKPQFVYETITVDYENNPEDILQTLPDGSLQLILRDRVKEQAFYNDLRNLHNLFQKQVQNNFYYLPFDDVMKKNWFINTVHQLQDNDIPVLGMQELKKFRYNTNKPVWDMKAGSGIDWFDLSIKVSFGDQSVPLKDIRKALLNKQNIVLLGDGTIGVLPEEWLKQYGLLLKMGDEQKEGTLRLSKLHYTLIDELHDQIDEEQVLAEINDKKQRLQNIDDVKTIKVSKEIKASLRPYQQSSFHWLQTLDELGWGGCLADDMGLGKTLQTITFLQFLKEKYKGCTNLVICPTSLIYNWETELKKFAPSLTYHIYYGTAREFSNEHFDDYDIIITSYGIIRNDLEHLLQFNWHYVILDESQTIKNPDAQTTKAVQLLKSKNRLILSGTPVQNNTYDLYAQFNFINPGLLGNRDFFKEFANGIDKYNDAEKAAQLRKMVYPFMLRRTKEQVAPDLPDKTEMVLWCEMSKEQRAVYDDFKNYYRTTLIKKIEEVGMAKASIYILEGLLRLRQICDSPALLKSDDVTTSKSIKIDELIREIRENSGQHKLLVFSQFTGMLQLIKVRMEEAGINYVYLDGSTTAVNRKKHVDDFQTDPLIKVFLISLKAGGLGLNLTAADYVYMVDPWWNPAVEQQAIDRTHRIGQTRKIFSYKMICKNTIEEKIMELQQKKKQIAKELISEDTGFIKKLKKDDIEFLFN